MWSPICLDHFGLRISHPKSLPCRLRRRLLSSRIPSPHHLITRLAALRAYMYSLSSTHKLPPHTLMRLHRLYIFHALLPYIHFPDPFYPVCLDMWTTFPSILPGENKCLLGRISGCVFSEALFRELSEASREWFCLSAVRAPLGPAIDDGDRG